MKDKSDYNSENTSVCQFLDDFSDTNNNEFNQKLVDECKNRLYWERFFKNKDILHKNMMDVMKMENEHPEYNDEEPIQSENHLI